MGGVKAGWRDGPLIDFADLVSTGPFGSMLHKSDYVSDGVPLINPVNIVDEEIVPNQQKQVSPEAVRRLSSYVLRNGDVVVGRRGEIGRCAVVGPKESGWVCGTGCFFVRPAGSVDPTFLAHLLRSPRYREMLEDASTGATMKNMSNSTLAQLPISLPALEEQLRIVAVLDEAFEGIATAKANAEKNLQSAQGLFSRLIAAVLENTDVRVSMKALEEVVEADCSLSYGIVQPGDEQPNGLLIVRPVDLTSNIVSSKGLKRIDPALARSYARTTLRGNDLLLCVRGTTGTMSMADRELAGANVTRGIVPIRFDAKQVDQQFGFYLLRSEPVQAQIRAKTYGTALMQINIRDLRVLQLSIPPLGTQREIVAELEQAEIATQQLTSTYERKLVALGELKKSLLHQAFTGQL